jgi:uncharacterized protein (TIGR02301 family)
MVARPFLEITRQAGPGAGRQGPRLALLCAFVGIGALFVRPATAQDRSPAERQTLTDLAYVLGESHALRQVCAGADDQYWRTRMTELVRMEQPDADFDRQLKESFNTGFTARRGGFPSCTAKARRQAAADAAHGRELSATLATEMADDETPR